MHLKFILRLSLKNSVEIMEIQISELREYYEVINSRTLEGDPRSTQDRVNIIRLLEKVSNSDFKNTQDFHRKMGNFSLKHVNMATTLHVYENFIGTDPLVSKSMQIWADKRKSEAKKLASLKAQG